jgi:hypothetical protein
MDYSEIGTAAAETEDQSVEKASARPLPRAGVALLRLRSYYETGRHAAKSAQHKAAMKVIMTFELLHPDHMVDTDDGKRPMMLTVRVNKTASSKGRFLPLFQKMNWDGKAKHMVQMLGKPFLGQLTHNKSEDGKTTYVNLDDAQGAWQIGPPQQVDALMNTVTTIPVPELHGEVSAFLWENDGISDEQIQGMWDAIFIEGTRTDGNGKEVSKNWIQQTVKEGLDWEGSRTQQLVEESVSVDELSVPAEQALIGEIAAPEAGSPADDYGV